MMRVSVVIPTHNRPDRTHRAVESALAQSRLPAEVIVVDDASDPPYSFPGNAKNAHLVRTVRLDANRGASGARQAGVDAAVGTHVAFLDSDDAWMSEKLDAQVAELARLGDAERVVMCCGWEVIDPESGYAIETRTPIPTSRLIDFCSGCWYAPGSTALLPRRLLSEIGGFDGSLRRLEDLDLFIRLGLSGARLEVVPLIGARIERGQNARIEDVAPAIDELRRRYLSDRSPLDRAERRRLSAWLHVELAVSGYFDRRWFTVVNHLTRSWIKAPRTRLQLQRWWT